jgi:hypothetical protein
MLIRAISSVVERLPYKEEVAGSNPASPTYKTPAKTVFCGQGERAGKTLPGSLTATRIVSVSRIGSQGSFHRVNGGVLHVWEYVGVGIDGDSYRGVA